MLFRSFLGCPVVGDRVYGHKHPSLPLKRHFLHAARLRIKLLDESEASEFKTPLPEELTVVLDELQLIAEFE